MKGNSSECVFVQDLNPLSGSMEWQVKSKDYDYLQEVARAGYADMLHDAERNQLYYEGLKAAIGQKRSQGQQVHVLDIGTGTGLLSMMAASLGADIVTAVEEFRPMAACAKRVIERNGFDDKIRLVTKRSTSVRVGPGLDMECRANILVTEVFDTELIGEGAISTFNHAHQELLTTDCLVVPTSAKMFAQVVKSDLASRWTKLHPINLGKENGILTIDPPAGQEEPLVNSSVSLALHDLQLSQIKEEWFQKVTPPLTVFSFDFSGRSGKIPLKEQTVTETKTECSGSCDAVFVWWELKMDPNEDITLSCAPVWAHPSSSNMAWRDHWMQAVYYPLSDMKVQTGERICVISNHDEYSLWFDVTGKEKSAVSQVEMPHPMCGVHLVVSRTRLGQMNDVERNFKYLSCLRKMLSACSTSCPIVLCLGELSLLPLLAAACGAVAITREQNKHMRALLETVARINGFSSRLVLLDSSASLSSITEKVDCVICEPNFSLSLLPWHNLRFWYELDKFRDSLTEASPTPKIYPCRAELWVLPVKYRDLWKIRAPLKMVEGFDVSTFDKIILDTCDECDAVVEPHPLWEYPCVALAPPTKVLELNLTDRMPEGEIHGKADIAMSEAPGLHANGMALWMVWHLDESTSLSSGPVAPVSIGEEVEWDIHSKQGVHFFVKRSADDEQIFERVLCEATFNTTEADIEVQFELV